MESRRRLFLPLLLILLGTAAAAVNARDYWSIDCGGTEPFTDPNGITWVDDSLTAPPGGVPRSFTAGTSVWSSSGPKPLPRELSTLRTFPSNTTRKHCYTISDIGAGRKIMVRATFFYGNYDGKLNPPRFQLTFEADDLSPVAFGNNIYNSTTFEVIYTTRTNDTSVCVNRVHPGEDPFINSLEVRALPLDMYGVVNSSWQMSTMKRRAYGANNTVRYPYDAYDRLWYPGLPVAGQLYLRNTAPSVNVSSSAEAPPLLALEHATVRNGTDAVLNITATNLPSIDVPVYINMYFTEPSNLTGTGDVRAFHILKDGVPVTNTSQPVIPKYGQVREIFGVLLMSSATVFSLVPAKGSTLPPVISALEVFWVGDVLKEQTNSNDVSGLTQLQDQYPVLREWTGDPCLPSDFAWEWIGCSLSSPPRITKLLLNGLGLSGGVPDFSSFDALMNIDLHNNSFTGAIPEYLAKLPNIKLLNFADNNFTSIPKELYQYNSSLMLNVTGNPALCSANEYCVSTLNLPDASSNRTSPPVLSPPPPSTNGSTGARAQLLMLWMALLGLSLALL